jgi:hypothetical protein
MIIGCSVAPGVVGATGPGRQGSYLLSSQYWSLVKRTLSRDTGLRHELVRPKVERSPLSAPPGTRSFTGPGRGERDYLLLAAGVATPLAAAGAVDVGVAAAGGEAEDSEG